MTEENTQTSGQSREILQSASNQPIRENLVATAVHFLHNPKVSKSPLSHKTAFLQKKGLTEEEINLALARTSTNENISQQVSPLVNNPIYPVPILQKPHSVWYHIHRVGSSFIVIGIAIYGAYRIYKLYIEPWLFGEKADGNRLSVMEQQMIEMNKTLTQLKQTVCELHLLLSSKKEQNKSYQTEVNDYFPTPLVLNDLKAEVGSIKSLLLNRHQFPSIPKVSPTIPIWQMPEVSNANSTQNGNENPEPLDEENLETTSKVTVNGDMAAETDSNDTEQSTDFEYIKTASEINFTENINLMNKSDEIEVTDMDGIQDHSVDVDTVMNK